MDNNTAQKITAYGMIIALPFALGAFLLAWGPANQFSLTDPRSDGYVQPRSIATLVEKTQESTVTIFCDYGSKEIISQGTAWVIELENDMGDGYPTTLITNHHVIEECINGKGKVSIKPLFGKESPAVIEKWDVKNDLATIATAVKLKPLALSQYEPLPGYWVAAIGTADGYEGSVAFGNILNGTNFELLTTAALSNGNSGGPLIDNEGNVVGINSWGSKTQQYNGAMSLNALCSKFIDCKTELYWERDGD